MNEAVHRIHEIVLKAASAKFTIGKDVEANIDLFPSDLCPNSLEPQNLPKTLPFEILNAIFSCVVAGFLISYSLKKCNQRWSQTFHMSVTFLLLPVIIPGAS